MAKYELGAIYKINGRSGELYYVRLLTNDCYGVFSSLEGELNEETFAQTHYRLYFSCNSFPIKRGIWEKVVSSPNCTDIARWQRPQYLANFANFNMKLFLDQCRVFHEDGNLYQCESKEEFIRLVKSGKILFCFNTLPLAEFFREIANKELECKVSGFSSEARKALLTHSWPGNVRELRQKIMGAVLQAQTGLVTKEHLELGITETTSVTGFSLRNDEEDKERILRALKQADGNRKVAAELLGIGRTTLYNKLEEYGLKYKFEQP